MIEKNHIKQKGITLVTLSIAIIMMLIITSILVFNANTSIIMKNLDNMYQDIELLKDKIDLYYAKYKALPIINTKYSNINTINSINPNDNENYYVIDLEALDNLTLNYGKDYKDYKNSKNDLLQDIYIVNEQSHNIYYVKGIRVDKKTYYTPPEEYSKLELLNRNCNEPKLAKGMTPVKWQETDFIKTESYDVDWYNYIDTSLEQNLTTKWANAQTQDGSMWVWIPRFAYKITYLDEQDKSKGGTIDVVFLKDETNKDFNDNDVTNEEYTNSKGEIGAYIVHPAFQNGEKTNFTNGEWSSDITGFWMAKFEAGYEQSNLAKDSNIEYSTIKSFNGTNNIDFNQNYYGTRQVGTKIKYPVFKPNKPSINYISIADVFKLTKSLTSANNPYGLSNVDSHLTKNSEWGAVSYLAYSKYGTNAQEVNINNVSVNSENTTFAVTGYGASQEIKNEVITSLNSINSNLQQGDFKSIQGQMASTTGNMYGIYDLNGGMWEYTSGYIGDNIDEYGEPLKLDSNIYKNKYAGISNENILNYQQQDNIKRVGEAIWEVSKIGTGATAWNNNTSEFGALNQFTIRGGNWQSGINGGLFAFSYTEGFCNYKVGFRAILIVK